MRCSAMQLLGAGLMAALTLSAHAADLRVWRHGMTEAKSNAGFVAMVAQPGFAEKYGIKVELVQLKNDALAQRALLSGSLDSYEGGPAIVAAAKGAPIKVVGCSWIGISIGLFATPAIKSLSQIGKAKIAASAPGALPELLTRAVMKQHKLDASGMNFVGFGSDAERYKSVAVGVVDVAALDMEHQASAEHDKLNLIADFEDEFPGYARFCIHMSDQTIASRRSDAVNFLAAEMNALAFAKATPDKTIALTRSMTSAAAEDPRARLVFDQAMRHQNVHPELPLPEPKILAWHDLLLQSGAFDKPLPMQKFLDGSLRAEALKQSAQAPQP